MDGQELQQTGKGNKTEKTRQQREYKSREWGRQLKSISEESRQAETEDRRQRKSWQLTLVGGAEALSKSNKHHNKIANVTCLALSLSLSLYLYFTRHCVCVIYVFLYVYMLRCHVPEFNIRTFAVLQRCNFLNIVAQRPMGKIVSNFSYSSQTTCLVFWNCCLSNFDWKGFSSNWLWQQLLSLTSNWFLVCLKCRILSRNL